MYDFHMHSIFSDGELIPAELAQRCAMLGFKGIAVTDHADNSNLELVLSNLARACEELSKSAAIEIIPGIELTHLPPKLIAPLTRKAKKLGARIVIVHGETIVEPVPRGTNKAAVETPEVDILAHPGLISVKEAELARENEIYLELSGRRGHCFTNGHVAKVAHEAGAALLVNSDAHAPEDLASPERLLEVARGAGLSEKLSKMVANENPKGFLRRI